MTVYYHPSVQQDLNEALAYYEVAGGVQLPDRFEAEFRASVEAVRTMPTRFSPLHRGHAFRRIRLDRFPYVVVYREIPAGIRTSFFVTSGVIPYTVSDVGRRRPRIFRSQPHRRQQREQRSIPRFVSVSSCRNASAPRLYASA